MYFLSTPVPASAPQRLIDVGDQVTGIFQSTGHAHQIRTDTGGTPSSAAQRARPSASPRSHRTRSTNFAGSVILSVFGP